MTAPGEVAALAARVRERPTQRTARYVLAGAEPSEAKRIWFVLHGYGTLATRFVRAFEGTIPADTCIVAPEGLSRFYLEMPRADGGHMQRIGATWLTRESRETEIDDAHHWLNAVHDEVVAESKAARGATPLTGVLGFSQGVATAMRWIATGHIAPRQFVAWAGSIALDADRDAFRAQMRESEMVVVTGTQDPFVTDTARASLAAAIETLAVPCRFLTFDGAHHLDSALVGSLLRGLGQSE